MQIGDYRMPQPDGVTLLAGARELHPRTVRMKLSAATDVGTVLAVLRAALAFDPCAAPNAAQLERRRLEALEPGITQVEWAPSGEVLMPGHVATRSGRL